MTGPSHAVLGDVLASETNGAGVLVRVGAQFGWAGAASVVIDTVGGPRWTALELARRTAGHCRPTASEWSIEGSEGNVNL